MDSRQALANLRNVLAALYKTNESARLGVKHKETFSSIAEAVEGALHSRLDGV